MSLDISNTEFGRWSQVLMKTLVNLHGMNAEAVLDSNLPRVVVFGDQSAGKSSVVEGVTGIRVPRDSGTCTRCPMELSMFSTGDTWSCDISLHFKYDANGQPLKLADERRVGFGRTLFDKSQVESSLRRAQIAILNPYRPHEEFLSMSESELKDYRYSEATKTALKFSRNTISVTIHDPNGANLSILDLPGLITNEDTQILALVQELAISEIRKENSLILVTIPMTGDMELQTALRLASDVDPEGLRTIGVLTKPDAVPKGASSARKTWMKILSGRERMLKHGYYCLRLPDDDERTKNLTREEYHVLASQFFEKEAPWNTLNDKRRLGIPGLVTDVGSHLTILIEKVLPKLQAEVQRKLEKCQFDLNALPPPPQIEAPTAEILGMVSDFAQKLNTIMQGGDEYKKLVQENRASYDKFMKAIRATAPNFIPRENFTYRAENEDEEEERNEDDCDSDFDNDATEPLYLRDVRQIIKSSITWKLPNNIPFDAKKRLIKKFTDLWTTPAISCYDEVSERLEELLQTCISKHFSYYHKLQDHISALVEERLQQIRESALVSLEKILGLEQSLYFTQNWKYFNRKRNFWLLRFQQKRECMRKEGAERVGGNETQRSLFQITLCFQVSLLIVEDNVKPALSFDPPMQHALGALKEHGYEIFKAEDLERLLKTDPFEEELIVMADVRAYFHVGYKRIIDNVPLTIELFLNQGMCSELQNWLVQKLDVSGPDALVRMRGLLAQDPKITSARDKLTAEISKLRSIQRELRGLRFSERPTIGSNGITDDRRGLHSVQSTLSGGTHRKFRTPAGSDILYSGSGR